MSFGVFFAWYDLWIGFYWDRKNRVLYFCPLPCVVIWFKFLKKTISIAKCPYDL